MILIPIDDLIIPENRHRKRFDEEAIDELADSIRNRGLLHPLVVRSSGDDQRYILVAGERRLRAIYALYSNSHLFTCGTAIVPTGLLPVNFIGDLPQEEAHTMELEENVVRRDLTWKEHCVAVKDLHDFYVELDPAWTLANTAEKLVGHDRGNATKAVTHRILVAQELDNPTIADCQNMAQAVSAVRKLYEQDFTAALGAAAAVGASVGEAAPSAYVTNPDEVDWGDKPPLGPAPIFVEDVNERLLQGDCLEVMRGYEAEAFDCILTDPPYGYGAEKFKGGTTMRHTYDDSQETWQELMRECLQEFDRITKPQAHLYIFCSLEGFFNIKDAIELIDVPEDPLPNFDVWPRPLIWVKDRGFPAKVRYGPEYTYECILYAIKGKREVKVVRRDTLRHATVKSRSGKIHAAQKPVELYTDLLERSCGPGDVVLDPFAGSGTIFEAARKTNVIAHGIELDEKMANIARARLHGEYVEIEDEIDEPAAEDLFGDID